MRGLLLTAGLCVILFTTASSNRLVCYYNREAATRASAGTFTPSMIDPNLCTHIIFSYAEVDDQNNLVLVESTDAALYTELNNLKASNPQLKTLLAVGGPGFNSQRFWDMILAVFRRDAFINSATTLIQDNGFDGLNLDLIYADDTNTLCFLKIFYIRRLITACIFNYFSHTLLFAILRCFSRFFPTFFQWVFGVFLCWDGGSKGKGSLGTIIHLLLHCRLLDISCACLLHSLISAWFFQLFPVRLNLQLLRPFKKIVVVIRDVKINWFYNRS